MNPEIITGDALSVLRTLPDEIAQTCVTSPPYWGLRDYGAEGQLGLEKTPDEYVAKLVEIFREVRRVLKKDGTLWLNLGDCYNAGRNGGHAGGGGQGARACYLQRSGANAPGLKPKDLVGIPWMVAFALRDDGWYLRSDIIWAKPNPMPESVRDRPTKAHEYVFLLAKSERYYYDAAAVMEPATGMAPGNKSRQVVPGERVGDNANIRNSLHKIGARQERNRRTIWTIRPHPFKGAHFATFPKALVRPCILAGSGVDDLVLDPFNGAGTTGLVALELRRRYLGIEINPEYVELTHKRLSEVQMELFA